MKIFKKTAPRIDPKAAEFYAQTFGTLNGGMEYIADSFPSIYQQTINRLKGMFTRDELRLMLDVFQGLWLTPRMAGQHLAAQDLGDELNEKVSRLTLFGAACMEIWLHSYWKNDAQESVADYTETLA